MFFGRYSKCGRMGVVLCEPRLFVDAVDRETRPFRDRHRRGGRSHRVSSAPVRRQIDIEVLLRGVVTILCMN